MAVPRMPDTTLPTLEFVQRPGAVWTAAHAKPRREKQVAQFCARFGIRHYLPLRREIKRYQRRNVEVFLPMFRGYLFVQLQENDKTRLIESHRVVHILTISPQQETQLLAELADIRKMEEAARVCTLTVRPELVPGKAVLVSAGPLCGVRGVVERRRQGTRVSVNVELLGQSVSVELDVGEVEVEA